MASLFTVPIPSQGSHAGGQIVCTEPAPQVYLLTWTSPPDNRLTSAFCDAVLDCLDIIEFGGYAPGVVVTTSGVAKFYSNGLDLEHAITTPGFWTEKLNKLFTRFLTYPYPTIALINGHAFAGGLMLAMHHDYRIMNPQRGFACLNELDFGAALKPAMSAIFRLKTPPQTYRSLALEAHRFTGPEALKAGIVDGDGGLEEVLKLVEGRKLTEKGKTGIYGALKREMYRESVAIMKFDEREEERCRAEVEEDEKRKEEGARRVGELKGKAKL
ncbi:ClpP/crotonase-like domain-containing protein [Coniochaeta sp. 2T2.1]|nr:ClpP/crotonase-like domain-containing protein [Coniochaeta sp. 2T2.1]